MMSAVSITGGIALRRSDGRARAGAGLGFGLAVLVSVLEDAIVMASIAAMIPASVSTF
jgi:hypothetical protein